MLRRSENHKASTDSCQVKQHLGVDFVVWERDSSWFWFLIHPINEGGMIGASGNKAQAMREARLSIEEIIHDL
jgi:hypothetical protein